MMAPSCLRSFCGGKEWGGHVRALYQPREDERQRPPHNDGTEKHILATPQQFPAQFVGWLRCGRLALSTGWSSTTATLGADHDSLDGDAGWHLFPGDESLRVLGRGGVLRRPWHTATLAHGEAAGSSLSPSATGRTCRHGRRFGVWNPSSEPSRLRTDKVSAKAGKITPPSCTVMHRLAPSRTWPRPHGVRYGLGGVRQLTRKSPRPRLAGRGWSGDASTAPGRAPSSCPPRFLSASPTPGPARRPARLADLRGRVGSWLLCGGSYHHAPSLSRLPLWHSGSQARGPRRRRASLNGQIMAVDAPTWLARLVPSAALRKTAGPC